MQLFNHKCNFSILGYYWHLSCYSSVGTHTHMNIYEHTKIPNKQTKKSTTNMKWIHVELWLTEPPPPSPPLYVRNIGSKWTIAHRSPSATRVAVFTLPRYSYSYSYSRSVEYLLIVFAIYICFTFSHSTSNRRNVWFRWWWFWVDVNHREVISKYLCLHLVGGSTMQRKIVILDASRLLPVRTASFLHLPWLWRGISSVRKFGMYWYRL